MTDPKLVEQVVASVLRQLAAGVPPCSCHQAAGGCCPDRMGQFVSQGAGRFGLQAAVDLYPREIARMIDHTLLKPEASRDQLEKLCREAREHGFATVCVNPVWVRLCADLLRGCETLVCTVVGFPLGATLAAVKETETRQVIADGASEVDMVMNVGALKSGDRPLVQCDIEAVVDACRAGRAISKVIIEAALLTDDEKRTACLLAKAAGADFVKTSTGFGPGGATVAGVALMRATVGPDLGIKAAGGVREYDAFQAMVRAGASASVQIVRQARGPTAQS